MANKDNRWILIVGLAGIGYLIVRELQTAGGGVTTGGAANVTTTGGIQSPAPGIVQPQVSRPVSSDTTHASTAVNTSSVGGARPLATSPTQNGTPQGPTIAAVSVVPSQNFTAPPSIPIYIPPTSTPAPTIASSPELPPPYAGGPIGPNYTDYTRPNAVPGPDVPFDLHVDDAIYGGSPLGGF